MNRVKNNYNKKLLTKINKEKIKTIKTLKIDSLIKILITKINMNNK